MQDISGDQFLRIWLAAQNLKEKILNLFEKTLHITKAKARRGSLVHHSNVKVEELLKNLITINQNIKIKLLKTIFLKKIIMNEVKRELLNSVKLK